MCASLSVACVIVYSKYIALLSSGLSFLFYNLLQIHRKQVDWSELSCLFLLSLEKWWVPVGQEWERAHSWDIACEWGMESTPLVSLSTNILRIIRGNKGAEREGRLAVHTFCSTARFVAMEHSCIGVLCPVFEEPELWCLRGWTGDVSQISL